MIGIPGSTREDIECTIEYASRALDIDFAKFTVFVPYPGTADYENLRKAGAMEEPENWNRFTSYQTRNRPPAYVPDGMTADDLIRLQIYLLIRMAVRLSGLHYFSVGLHFIDRLEQDAAKLREPLVGGCHLEHVVLDIVVEIERRRHEERELFGSGFRDLGKASAVSAELEGGLRDPFE